MKGALVFLNSGRVTVNAGRHNRAARASTLVTAAEHRGLSPHTQLAQFNYTNEAVTPA